MNQGACAPCRPENEALRFSKRAFEQSNARVDETTVSKWVLRRQPRVVGHRDDAFARVAARLAEDAQLLELVEVRPRGVGIDVRE